MKDDEGPMEGGGGPVPRVAHRHMYLWIEDQIGARDRQHKGLTTIETLDKFYEEVALANLGNKHFSSLKLRELVAKAPPYSLLYNRTLNLSTNVLKRWNRSNGMINWFLKKIGRNAPTAQEVIQVARMHLARSLLKKSDSASLSVQQALGAPPMVLGKRPRSPSGGEEGGEGAAHPAPQITHGGAGPLPVVAKSAQELFEYLKGRYEGPITQAAVSAGVEAGVWEEQAGPSGQGVVSYLANTRRLEDWSEANGAWQHFAQCCADSNVKHDPFLFDFTLELGRGRGGAKARRKPRAKAQPPRQAGVYDFAVSGGAALGAGPRGMPTFAYPPVPFGAGPLGGGAMYRAPPPPAFAQGVGVGGPVQHAHRLGLLAQSAGGGLLPRGPPEGLSLRLRELVRTFERGLKERIEGLSERPHLHVRLIGSKLHAWEPAGVLEWAQKVPRSTDLEVLFPYFMRIADADAERGGMGPRSVMVGNPTSGQVQQVGVFTFSYGPDRFLTVCTYLVSSEEAPTEMRFLGKYFLTTRRALLPAVGNSPVVLAGEPHDMATLHKDDRTSVTLWWVQEAQVARRDALPPPAYSLRDVLASSLGAGGGKPPGVSGVEALAAAVSHAAYAAGLQRGQSPGPPPGAASVYVSPYGGDSGMYASQRRLQGMAALASARV